MVSDGEKDTYSPELHQKLNTYIKEANMSNVRVRGLRVTMHDDMTSMNFCEMEVCCVDENGLLNFVDVMMNCTANCTFIKLKIAYDVHKDTIQSNRKLGEAGFRALTYLFQNQYKSVMEFSLTDFHIESTPFLTFLECLTQNNQLMQVTFCRDDLSQDTAMMVLSKLYNTHNIKRIDISGNPISTGMFKE
eukprot:CAMPEP_0202965496 /NCGR_PEP_ID=MMETSP1396-20130829/9450_1 /ASSEMBLY_ACC=CAM_ASM_000872 /TAXON_ID= /ORGANISM="Pseudokeronopsis sp., Strain Brazil" /LENGTH=189 /DNA_ID=CAMNT_0049688227 /DNA_START=84 /DNA_END=653 /DNA_ORIENTATION=+